MQVPDHFETDRILFIAARNLYTSKVNADVVNRLLEHPKFSWLTAMIVQYLDDTFADGIAAQNQIFSSMSDIFLGIGRQNPSQKPAAQEAARAINLSMIPPRQIELTKIPNIFMSILREMKRDIGSGLESSKAATKEVVEKMVAELAKGQDKPMSIITPEQITDAILRTAASTELAPETLTELRGGLIALFENLPRTNDAHDE